MCAPRHVYVSGTSFSLPRVDLLTLRAAAGGGSIDGRSATSLVAAGFTLLQRSPVLVRALAGRRAGILLPTSPQFLVALAAADGRGAVLVNPLAAPSEIAYQCADAAVGAILTLSAFAPRIPPGMVMVLLDDAPATATVVASDGTTTRIDLGSHFGLEVEGDAEAPGRDEECAIVYTSGMAGRALGAILTHRNLITNARAAVQAAAFTPGSHLLAVLPFSHLFGLTVSGIAPLLAGARVSTMARFNPITAVDRIVTEGITAIVGVPAIFSAMPPRRGAPRSRVAGALDRGHRRGDATGVRPDRSLTGRAVQSHRPTQCARDARTPLPRRAGERPRSRHRRGPPGGR